MILDQTTQHQRIHQRIISCENIDILIYKPNFHSPFHNNYYSQ